jgi:two-component system phosphate regulon sensor histidine kinase PhoR
MVNTLYSRLMMTQFLLVLAGGLVFWLCNIVFGLNDPISLMICLTLVMLGSAVVVGLLLHPVDQVHLALTHVANAEAVPLPAARSEDMRKLVTALEVLQRKVGTSADSAELMGVLNSLSEGIMILGTDRRILMVNTAMGLIAHPETVSGAPNPATEPEAYRSIFHARCFVPDQLALIEDEMYKHPDRPRTDIVQLERPTQYIKRYSSPLTNDEGEHTGFLVSYHDITHEVLQDQMRQEFIANASHELRTPVTSVKVLLENLDDGAKDDPEVADEFLNDALREIDRMHELVNDLLDLAALESGRNQLQLTDFEVVKVLKDAVETVAPQAKQRDVDLVPEWPGPDVRLEADLSRVRQVLVNLVANAVKFTPSGGKVTVKAWVEGGQVRFMVSDSGIGIPSKDLPHIFDRFYRVTKGRSRLQGGSGLGLTIVKQAIDAHRGEISVESTEGKGTTFYFQLPASQRVEA